MDDAVLSRFQSLQELFQSEVHRIDQVLAEREKQTVMALQAAERAIEKADIEAERTRQAANEWRGAMMDREANFATTAAMQVLADEVKYIRRGLDTGAGRRAAWIAAAGIIATLLAIGVGQIIRQGITAADVSQQITREAPWNKDKDAVERRITVLEGQMQRLQVEVGKLREQLVIASKR
jgi:hypothetical protein